MTAAEAGEARAGVPAPAQAAHLPPTSVRLPDGVRMPVVAVATLPDGGLEVPRDVGTAGWWSGGGRLGDLFGSMVLVGHVDAADQGIGAMAGLLRARPGQLVQVAGAGARQRFRVVSVTQVPKVDLTSSARDSPFDQTGDLRLVLITCSGPFDRTTRHYRDNQVVVAEPLDPGGRSR